MLNINSLNNVRDLKELNKFQIYKKVLSKCHHRIKTVSLKGDSYCFYVIPEYIFGIPKYDKLSCAEFITNKLKQNGFNIAYTYPNLLFISWSHIPSQLSKRLLKNPMRDDSNKNIEDSQSEQFRFKDDYKPSKNFLKKIN